MAGRLYWPAWGCLLQRCTWAIPEYAMRYVANVASSWLKVAKSCQPLSGGLGLCCCFPAGLAAAAGAGGSVPEGWWMYSAWRRFMYPCLGGDGGIAACAGAVAGTSSIIGSVVIALAYLRNAGAASLRCGGGRTDGADSPDHVRPWLADINAVDTTVVAFRIIRCRRWRGCVTSIFSTGVSQRREVITLPQAVAKRQRTLVAGGVLLLLRRICCATSSLVLADG